MPVSTHKKFIAALAIAALPLVPTVAGAKAGEFLGSCEGDYVITYGPKLTLVDPALPSISASISLPAGEYSVTTTSWDMYDARETTEPQLFEQYFLEFVDAGGAVIASTGATPDLVDGVKVASWSGSLGTVELDRPAAAVRAVHLRAGNPPAWIFQEVYPACVGLNLAVTPTTSTTTTTTTLPETPTEPETPSEPETPTTPDDPGASSSTTTTTTLPVAGPPPVSPPAQETPGTPTFTG